ncbi:hypothetical protein SAMN05216188_12320 [Lentzea xinjiangensis]|uniref:Uncharacterized protein n=1 Tax=Lentzea xinjiangensis TaxID=402600 RepID=A0A1H9UYD0_9PSEU|nr:hypothetical protein [Lentzea xinjiangensis]SES14331.1 hypothetical protein SAMN05216188_12320 [Lentzea xinjiangensis]
MPEFDDLWISEEQESERHAPGERVLAGRVVHRRFRCCHELELVAGPSLGIVCLRYRQGSDELQTMIGRTINESDRTFITTTTVDGVVALRLCTINPRTTRADLDRVLTAIVAAGRSATS